MKNERIGRFQTTRDTVFAPFSVVRERDWPEELAAWLESEGVTEACPGRRLVRMRKSGLLFVIDLPAWFRGARWDSVVLTRYLG